MRSCLVVVLVAVLCFCQVSSIHNSRLANSIRRVSLKQQSPAPAAPFHEWEKTADMAGEDPFVNVRSVIDHLDATNDAEPDDETSLLQVEAQTGAEAGRVRSFCEICILIMQMKERGQPHLCAGLNDQHYMTCIENLESLLRADKAVVYWLKNGCMHMDSTGPEIVRPCPALNICSWVPNLFAQPPSLVRDGVESVCPKDPKFLPTMFDASAYPGCILLCSPNEYKTLLQPQTAAVPGPGAAGGAGAGF